MNVVLLVRVSTSQQDYQRQVTELTQFCQAQNWNICNVSVSDYTLNFAFNCNNYRNYYQCVDYQHLESMLPFDRQFLRAFCRYICNNYDFEVFLLNSHVFKHL